MDKIIVLRPEDRAEFGHRTAQLSWSHLDMPDERLRIVLQSRELCRQAVVESFERAYLEALRAKYLGKRELFPLLKKAKKWATFLCKEAPMDPDNLTEWQEFCAGQFQKNMCEAHRRSGNNYGPRTNLHLPTFLKRFEKADLYTFAY